MNDAPTAADDGHRAERVRQVINDYLARRAAGELLSEKQLLDAHPHLLPELADGLARIRRVFQSSGKTHEPQTTPALRNWGEPSRGLHIRCPHCHNAIEILADDPLIDVTCTECGSTFSIVGRNEDTMTATPLQSLGHFQLVERLGVGAFGTVWKAHDLELDRTVAIKIPRRGQLEPLEEEQFLREARVAAQLRHPNIVSVHEIGREGDTLYIVSDLVRGVSLSDWLAIARPTFREAAELCGKIAETLHHAHQAGIVHRDLKPSNIMIDHQGEPHLMDFGLAKRDVGEITITVDGNMLGTPTHMSPEQARGDGHRADRRTDIYSMGVILFQFLTGDLPFRGNTKMIIYQVLNDEAPSPRKLDNQVPRDLETICLKCLEKEPEKRYPTAQNLADDLRRYLRQEPITARPINRVHRFWRWARRNPVTTLSVATVSLVLVITLISITAVLYRGYLAVEQMALENDLMDSLGYLAVGQSDQALSLLNHTLELKRAKLGQNHPHTLTTQRNLASIYLKLGRHDDGLRIVEENLRRERERLSKDDPRLADVLTDIAQTLLDSGQSTVAESHVRECLTIYDAADIDDWRLFEARSMLGEALADQKLFAQAESLLIQGYEGMKAEGQRLPGPTPQDLRAAAQRLVNFYKTIGKSDDASRWQAESDQLDARLEAPQTTLSHYRYGP
jgi:serine/threonine protein kinase